MIRSAICCAGLDVGSLHVDRADAELLVSEQAFEMIGVMSCSIRYESHSIWQIRSAL